MIIIPKDTEKRSRKGESQGVGKIDRKRAHNKIPLAIEYHSVSTFLDGLQDNSLAVTNMYQC